MTKNKIIDALLETAKSLDMKPITIKEIESLKLKEIKQLSSNLIKLEECVKKQN